MTTSLGTGGHDAGGTGDVQPQPARDDGGLVSRWTPEQRERARAVVNDIAEGIDNHETRSELRQLLAIYADLFHDALEKRADEKTTLLIEQMNKLTELTNDMLSARKES